MERRINLSADKHDPQAALKQIAGLIQKLSYRDMNHLADILGNHISGETKAIEVVAKGLLDASDAIMSADRAPAVSEGPFRR